MVVIENQYHALIQLIDIVDQSRGDDRQWWQRIRVDHAQRLATGVREHCAQCRDEVRQEDPGVAVGLVQGQPAVPMVLNIEPVTDGGTFPVSCRCSDERQG